MHPYWGKGVFGFLATFLHRIILLLTGQLPFSEMASDELQILVLSCISLSCALIGALLVVRKMTMMANSISHTVLVGVVIAFVFMQSTLMGGAEGVLHIDMKMVMIASLITAILTMLCTDVLQRVFRIQEDASIGLVFSLFFAVGIVLVTVLSRNTHIGSELIMGNVDMVHRNDLGVAAVVLLANAIFTLAFYKELLLTAFDPTEAKMQRVPAFMISYLLMFQTSLTVVSSFRIVGVVLVLSLLVTPALTARLWVSTLRKVILLSGGISLGALFFAVALARSLISHYGFAISTAGLLSTLHLGIFLMSLFLSPQKGVLSRYLFEKFVWKKQKVMQE